MDQHKPQLAFTLIEMVGILAIIAILTGVLAPPILESFRNEQIELTIDSINDARQAAASYQEHYGAFPLDTVTATKGIINHRKNPTEPLQVPSTGFDFGDILVYQTSLLDTEKTAIGAETKADSDRTTVKSWAIGCAAIHCRLTAGGGDSGLAYGSEGFVFKSAEHAACVVYYYLPNITRQEAAGLGIKMNGADPSSLIDDAILEQSLIGKTPAEGLQIAGTDTWFIANQQGASFDAYIYLAHE
ncbi:MAG: type II secretion system protein [Opitutales bacterium]